MGADKCYPALICFASSSVTSSIFGLARVNDQIFLSNVIWEPPFPWYLSLSLPFHSHFCASKPSMCNHCAIHANSNALFIFSAWHSPETKLNGTFSIRTLPTTRTDWTFSEGYGLYGGATEILVFLHSKESFFQTTFALWTLNDPKSFCTCPELASSILFLYSSSSWIKLYNHQGKPEKDRNPVNVAYMYSFFFSGKPAPIRNHRVWNRFERIRIES